MEHFTNENSLEMNKRLLKAKLPRNKESKERLCEELANLRNRAQSENPNLN